MSHSIPVDGSDEAATCGIAGSAACILSADSTAVRDAYWYASRLINVGWTIRRIGTTDRRGFFVAETPRRRVVSVVEPADASSDPAAQFARSVRAAYWFAVTLTDDYGWKLFEIGRDTARGGFIADVPGEAMAVYPASISDDRTVASAFARLLARMSANEMVIVAALVEWHSSARHHEGRRVTFQFPAE